MLHRLAYADWEDPPEAMAFEVTYLEALAKVRRRFRYVLQGAEHALVRPAELPPEYWQQAMELFLYTPALVNVALNYKVCVEQGLPLHPTHYFEVNDRNRHRIDHGPALRELAQRFFLDAIAASVAVFRLDPAAVARLERLATGVPPEVGGYVYTSTRDRYTWRASEPAKVIALARDIQAAVQPALLLGAAHGAILAGLTLASLIDAPLYFVRLSLFKRKDTEPVMGPSDFAWLEPYRTQPVVLFDEDVAKGTTLTLFTDRLAPLFDTSWSAGVLRHGHADFRPDFVGKVWYD